MSNIYISTVLNYGPELPSTTNLQDGALFFKTADPNGGLYIYNLSQDTQTGMVGDQLGKQWNQIVSLSAGSLFVPLAGGTMTGTLKVGGEGSIGGVSISPSAGAGFNPGVVAFLNGAGGEAGSIGWNQANSRLQITGPWVFATTPKVLTNDVWHAGNDGSGSGLDADLLDGQDGLFYRNASNMNAGALALVRGGTAADLSSSAPGGVVWRAGGALGVTAAGTSGHVLRSNGTAAPSWVDLTTLVPAPTWTAITGMQTGVVDFGVTGNAVSTRARPSLFFTMSSSGGADMEPAEFPAGSITGFDAPNTSGMGANQVGLTVTGFGSSGSRAVQLAANWDFEELAPSGGLRYRVNDTTGTITSWGAWRTVWDQGNLTSLSQLTNDAGFIGAAGLANYVLKAGDTMSGALTTPLIQLTGGFAVSSIDHDTITLYGASTGGSLSIQAPTTPTTNAIFNVTSTGSNYVFNGHINGEKFRINSAGAVAAQVTGDFQATGNVIAYASDARLKKNIQPIENASEKVAALVGYSYDWDMELCSKLNFYPSQQHEHGVIAQEVEKILPDAVAAAPFNSDYKTVRYERLVALLIAAVREQKEEIEQLKRQVAVLVSR